MIVVLVSVHFGLLGTRLSSDRAKRPIWHAVCSLLIVGRTVTEALCK